MTAMKKPMTLQQKKQVKWLFIIWIFVSLIDGTGDFIKGFVDGWNSVNTATVK
jgi:hypothetical protein